MSSGPESAYVEQPFIDQLTSMGWKFTTGNLDFPSATGRETFREVLLLDDLRKALARINLDDDGKPWLDETRVNHAVSALEHLGVNKLIEANQAATELLLKGKLVDGVPGWDGGRERTVQFIDWDHPENNTFRVVNQFRVDEPGGQGREFIVPDLVMFVNGIPLVVVECKSPGVAEPIEQAIDQLQRYSNQREWVEGNEGNERLFHYNHCMVATCFDEARVATLTAQAVHYQEWKDTSPVAMAQVAAELCKEKLCSQETLVAGMLRPAHLLDIVRHFVLFTNVDGKTIKVVPRYQQFRATQLAIQRLLCGKTRRQDGEFDRRGGIVWHTQGSGKSFTMVYIVRKMRSMTALRRFKVVVVTDRKPLEKQLSDTADLTGDFMAKAKTTDEAKELLSQSGPGLVFVMIQKYQEREQDADEDGDGEGGEGIKDTAAEVGEFPVLNEDDSILVLVDEAHRSHASTLHANLLRALPNCARIGFTGTPIIMGARKRTSDIFGDYIDRYTIKQSEVDGSTVPILYEGRTAEGVVADGRDLDQLFEDMFSDRTPEELERIKQKYATKGPVMEATRLIDAKAADMFRHYVDNILPNGFKAQLVAVSRRATIRYYAALCRERDKLVTQLGELDPALLHLDEAALAKKSPETQFLVRAYPRLDVIRALEFAPVISSGNNDDPAWRQWTDSHNVEQRIASFKKPFVHADPEKRSPLAFVIVKSMLLTGFDAPVDQVMYLDRPIKEAELLQAIARVNRPCGSRKRAGIVVDYYGVARHLKEALAVYSDEDVEGALKSLQDEIPKLRDRHRRVLDLFFCRGIDSIQDTDACVDVLGDERLRAEFIVKLKDFLYTLDLVLPRPQGLPYVSDAKTLGFIQMRARNRYRGDERPIGREVGEKVRKLIDDHVVAEGINPSIPPISLTDADFAEHVEREKSDRAKASEMEHALRYHIRKHFDEDPEYYDTLSERLAKILADLKDRWADLVEALRDIVTEARAGRRRDETGLDPETQAPFLGLIKQAVAGKDTVPPDRLATLCQVAVSVVEHVQQEMRLVDFWQNAYAQNVLRNWMVQFLDDHNLLPFERLPELADRLVELAKVNQHRLM